MMHKTCTIIIILLLGSLVLPSGAGEKLEPRLELGFNLGAINANDRQAYFWESSFLYPELGGWINLGEKARFGLTAGFIYVGYQDPRPGFDISKNISLFPIMLEMSVLHIEPGFEYQNLFMELGLGLGYFVTAGDIYNNANAWSLKIGAGMMSDNLIFSINAKVIGCKASTRETLTYTVDANTGETGTIGSEMNLGGVSIMIGVGMRYE